MEDSPLKTLLINVAVCIVTFSCTCVMMLMFSMQFGFDWSLQLSTGVWMAAMGIRYILGGTNGKR